LDPSPGPLGVVHDLSPIPILPATLHGRVPFLAGHFRQHFPPLRVGAGRAERLLEHMERRQIAHSKE